MARPEAPRPVGARRVEPTVDDLRAAAVVVLAAAVAVAIRSGRWLSGPWGRVRPGGGRGSG